MEKSEAINEVFLSLSKAQAKFKPAELDCYNSFFKAKYASLPSVQAAYKDALSENGLTIMQLVEGSDGKYAIKTVLGHASGQWISTTLQLILSKDDMQGLGSAIAYGRRQSIAAMLGIVDAEDDAGVGLAKEIVNKKNQERSDKIIQEFKDKTADHPFAPLAEPKKPLHNYAPGAYNGPLPDPTPINDADLLNSGEFKVPFGKFSGKTLSQIGKSDVTGYVKWFEEKMTKPYNQGQEAFLAHAKLFLSNQP